MKAIMARVVHGFFLLSLEDDSGATLYVLMDTEFNVIDQYKHMIHALKRARAIRKATEATKLADEAIALDVDIAASKDKE